MTFHDDYEEWDDDEFDDPDAACHVCGGEGFGVCGEDQPCRFGWDSPGEIVPCRCCGGSGLKSDCCYW